MTGIGKKPRVILGLMTYGPEASSGGRITTQEEFKKHLDLLQSRGYNEIDTARVYVGGKQEAFSREAQWKDRGFEIATKCYPKEPGMHKPQSIRNTLETSLKELGTDCVDIFYLHAPDRSVPFEETLQEVDKMHKEGKFVRLGLSNFTAFEVAEVVMFCKVNGWVRPTIYQGMYNPITRYLERELIPACRRYGLDVVIYNPIGGGLFSGKYTAADLKEQPTEGRFSDASHLGKNYRKRYFHEPTFEALAAIEPVVKKHNLTMLETALRWSVHHSALRTMDGNDGIIIGVSNLDQLKADLDDLEKGPLPDEVVSALDDGWKLAVPATPNYWHLDLKYVFNQGTRQKLADNDRYTYDFKL
ncbi:MAG: hypothetical protein Q9162_006655 [Coniocarpon cinnabarinum]